MLHRNYSAFVIAIVALPILVLSCRKNDSPFDNPDEGPPAQMPADPPVYVAYKVSDYESINLSFKYDEFPDKVSVYYDDTLTEDRYDHLFAEYSFNRAGYLTKNVFYNPSSGEVKSSLSIVRDNNTLDHILVEHSEASISKTDTFYISFRDSAGAAGYTIMNVDYGKYFSGIPVAMDFAYYEGRLNKTTAGMYTSGEDAIFFPSFNYRYNNANQLVSRTADLYYGADYMYEEGLGLDSLFKVLGGKDWPYLETVLNYDENTSIFFYPLYITLSKDNVDMDIYMHRYGALSEVRSMPNGVEYPKAEIFNFSNTFDESKKLVQSTIYNNEQEYASYRFEY